MHMCKRTHWFIVLIMVQTLMNVLMSATTIATILMAVYATTLLEVSSVSVHLATLSAMAIDAFVS